MQFVQGFLLVASSLLLICMAVYCLRHPGTPGARPLFALLIAAVIWSAGSFFEMYSSTFEDMLLWRNIQQIGVFGVPIATLYFAAMYTERRRLMKVIYGVTAIPLLSVILIFTNEFHHIMRRGYSLEAGGDFGQSLVVHSSLVGTLLVAFNFALPLVSVAMLLDFRKKVSAGFKKQVTLIIACFLFTFFVSLLKTAVLDPMGIYIFISVLYIPSAVILFCCLFRYHFLSLSPVARDKVFEVISQGILVMNREGVIVDANSHARRLIGEMLGTDKPPEGSAVGKLFHRHPIVGKLTGSHREIREEIEIRRDGAETYLSIDYYPLGKEGGRPIGSVMILNDITGRKLHEFNLREQAEKDSMTQLLNRNGFYCAYGDMKDTLYKKRQPLSAFMIDLDHFKRINDTYGHNSGDRILCHFAELIRSSLREQDIIGRIGGEEFSVILPGIGKEDAFYIAERIRRKTADSRVKLSEDQWVGYTVSIGVTDNRDSKKELGSILEQADTALYQAKNRSRNCTVLYEPAGADSAASTR